MARVNDTPENVAASEPTESSGPVWLTLPDIAEQLGVRITQVHRMLKDGELVAVRRGERNVLSVPQEFIGEDGPLPELRGTFTVLHDGGFTDEEIVEWMFARDDRLVGGTPIGAIRQGAKTEVRRRAMEEAL
nr:Rv2175c family DNA-binding protein [Janibacter cremeus]